MTQYYKHISQEPHKCGKLSGVQIFLVQVTVEKWPQDHYFLQKVLLVGTPNTSSAKAIKFPVKQVHSRKHHIISTANYSSGSDKVVYGRSELNFNSDTTANGSIF